MPPRKSTDRPVFIVGASRSGTTLMKACLNANPGIFIGGETHYFDDLRIRMRGSEQTPLTSDQTLVCEDYFMKLVHGLYGSATVKDWDPADERSDAPVRRDELRAMAEYLGPGADSYFEAFCRIQAKKRGRRRWGEKTPRHVFRIAEILGRYPRAKVICMVRDPRAVAASYAGFSETSNVTRAWFAAERAAWSREDNRRIRQSYHPLIIALLWKSSVKAAVAATARFGTDRVRIQLFESLVRDPEGTLTDLSEWLSIPFVDEMMTTIPQINSSFTAVAADQGPSASAVDRWRANLRQEEVAAIQSLCRRTMKRLGYERKETRAKPHAVISIWATLPFVVVRALAVNRHRIIGIMSYVLRRLRFAFSGTTGAMESDVIAPLHAGGGERTR